MTLENDLVKRIIALERKLAEIEARENRFDVSNLAVGSLTSSGDASIGGNLTVTGNANVGGNLSHEGYAGSIYVPLATWGAVYNNTTLAIGTYAINSQSYGVPAGAKAVEIRAAGVCATAASTNYIAFRATGVTDLNIVMRSVIASTLSDDVNGKVHLNASGQFDVVVAGAQWTTVYLYIAGYYI